MSLQTCSWQEKLEQQPPNGETLCKNSHPQPFSFARRKKTPVLGNDSTNERLAFCSIFETAAVPAAR